MKEKNIFVTRHDLPTEIPLFLVRGAVLMPKAHLPVPIFEQSQIPLLQDCLENNKVLGLIQPSNLPSEDQNRETIRLYTTGCLARITDVREHESVQMIVALEGICRFQLLDHTEGPGGYPMGLVDYQSYESDLADEYDFSMDRSRLFAALKPYFRKIDMNPDWEEFSKVSNHRLVSALSMACPLRPSEKQVLLEARNLKEQSEIFTKLIEMSAQAGHNSNSYSFMYH